MLCTVNMRRLKAVLNIDYKCGFVKLLLFVRNSILLEETFYVLPNQRFYYYTRLKLNVLLRYIIDK